jgi:hypothetical protein
VPPQFHPDASIFFSDIVGFTNICRCWVALLVQKYLLTGTKVQIMTPEELLQPVHARTDMRHARWALYGMQTFADVCWHMLTYADVCWCMQICDMLDEFYAVKLIEPVAHLSGRGYAHIFNKKTPEQLSPSSCFLVEYVYICIHMYVCLYILLDIIYIYIIWHTHTI